MGVRYHESNAAQPTLDAFFQKTTPQSISQILALLQMTDLPKVFKGPSHDFVRQMLDKAAERRAVLQDAAMASQVTEFTMKGDHTFKVAALGQTTLGTPFTAFHSIMGDHALILSCIFAKDESISSLEEQHKELKSRLFRLARALPRVYAVGKCCSFKQLIKQLEYTEDEIDAILAALKLDG